jgi:hypothetical protein
LAQAVATSSFFPGDAEATLSRLSAETLGLVREISMHRS